MPTRTYCYGSDGQFKTEVGGGPKAGGMVKNPSYRSDFMD